MKYDDKTTKQKELLNKKSQKKNEKDFNLCFTITTILLVFVFFLFILYSFHIGAEKADIILYNHSTQQFTLGMIKPVVDERVYRVIRLSNGLEVLLVSDASTSTCAASMAVGVGSYYDGEIYGLAHFFEHMLFLVIQS